MKQLNKFFSIIFLLITVFFSFYLKDLKVLCFVIYLGLTYILKLNSYLKFIVLTYGFISIFLGGLLHLYKITSWFDTFTHFLSGIYISLIAIYSLYLLKMWNKKNIIFNLIYILLFVMGIAGLWEITEFVVDNMFNMDMQRVTTGVYDTMKDMIVAFLGNILFSMWFYYEYKNNHKLLVSKFIDNMIGGSYGR